MNRIVFSLFLLFSSMHVYGLKHHPKQAKRVRRTEEQRKRAWYLRDLRSKQNYSCVQHKAKGNQIIPPYKKK